MKKLNAQDIMSSFDAYVKRTSEGNKLWNWRKISGSDEKGITVLMYLE